MRREFLSAAIASPAKALNLVLKLDAEDTKNTFNETHAMFSLGKGKTTLISRTIEEKYPNYESVLPLDNDKKLTVGKEQLLASVRRTALYASSTTRQVRFSLKKDSVAICRNASSRIQAMAVQVTSGE